MDITNAAQPADPVPIPVPAVQNLLPVIPVTQRQQSLLRNAEALVIPVRPMPAADTALPAARQMVHAVPACPARQLSTSLTLVTPGTQCRVILAKKHKPLTGCQSASKNFTNAKQFGPMIRKMPTRQITTAVGNSSQAHAVNPTASNAVINAAQTSTYNCECCTSELQ